MPYTRVSFKKNLDQHIKSSDGELKNYILVADRIELPALAKRI